MSTRDLVWQFSGAVLPDGTLGSLVPFCIGGENTILLGGDFFDLKDVSQSLSEIIVDSSRAKWTVYYPTVGYEEGISGTDFQNAVECLEGDGFSGTFLLTAHPYNLACYASTRDNLTCWSVPGAMVPASVVDEWDCGFADSLQREGVGFGPEGQRYILELISELADHNESFKRRLGRLIPQSLNPRRLDGSL